MVLRKDKRFWDWSIPTMSRPRLMISGTRSPGDRLSGAKLPNRLVVMILLGGSAQARSMVAPWGRGTKGRDSLVGAVAVLVSVGRAHPAVRLTMSSRQVRRMRLVIRGIPAIGVGCPTRGKILRGGTV